ncbi:MAG: mechanosensitive ion channel family protein [Actinomycetota bacterium]|nr:mechanosensitive ion channel family protein [Actinomycetota bacterium]
MTEQDLRAKRRGVVVGVLSGLLALAALVAGSAFGDIEKHALSPRLVAWVSAGVLLVFGAVSTTRLSSVLGRHVASTSMPSAGGAVRIVSAAVGYLIVIFGVLAVLSVSIEHLLVGAGLAGVVLGIAAQQSLGNVFAGLVLILARPFHLGDRVRVRSGALGGIFDARVREMTLIYVTLQTEEGEYKIPNSAMLAAGVARTPRTPLPSAPSPTAAPAPANAAPAPGAVAPEAPAPLDGR